MWSGDWISSNCAVEVKCAVALAAFVDSRIVARAGSGREKDHFPLHSAPVGIQRLLCCVADH